MRSIRARMITYSMMVLLLCFIAIAPVQAKAVKQPTVTETQYYYKNDSGKWQLITSDVEKYNKKGYYTGYKSTSYNEKGKKTGISRFTRSFNKKGKVAVEEYSYNNKLTVRSVYTYKGSKVTVKRYDKNKKYLGKDITTGKASRRTTKGYDAKGKLESKTVVTTKKGRKVKEVMAFYSKEGNLTSTTNYTYSGAAITEKIKTVTKSGTTRIERKYKEDKAGTPIYIWGKIYDNDGNVQMEGTYKYEKYKSGKAKGCVKKETVYVDGKAVSKTLYTVKKITRVKE